MQRILLLAVLFCFSMPAWSQNKSTEDSIKQKELDEVVVSFNKWEQKLNEVPNRIIKINRTQILRGNPQTSADLLAQTGGVFVQKSQMGGGSPMIRGFATNRVLLVYDGIRMNNAIYRSGNLQNVISIDPLAIETAEVIFGPGSLIYGSDAIGGVMDFHTLEAKFSKTDKLLLKGAVLARYATANKENTIHADLNLAGRKWSWLGSVSYSKFDDLKMGKNGGQDSYWRTEYVERVNNVDSIFKNDNPRVQKFSGYKQLNVLQKLRFKPSEYLDLQYSFTYAETGTAPRYDRLIQYRNGKLRFAEWNYGPMQWTVHALTVLHNKKNKLYDEARITLSYQDYTESRIDRTRASNNRNRQDEFVKAFILNWDAQKMLGKGQLFYGIEHVYNKVGSTGIRTNISDQSTSKIASRYPDGTTWSSSGIYLSYKNNLHEKVTFNTGVRYSYNAMNGKLDTSFISFPFTDISIKDGAITGNAGLVYRPLEGWQISGNLSTGFRMPNVDDAGKLFESTPGNITIPNPNLTSEYAWNFEIGLVRNIEKKFRFEIAGFHSILDNAIVRRPTTINGLDSIDFLNVRSRVESLQNVAKATVWGLQISVEYYFTKSLSMQSHANWVSGKETDDSKNEQVPLRHAPPFYGSTLLKYRSAKLYLEANATYNSKISFEDLAPTEQAKPDIYAKDASGKPFSPGWYTLNLKANWQWQKNLSLGAAWENITNQRYRPYSSGIVAAGSNLIISLRANF